MDIKSLCPDTSSWQIVLVSFRPDHIVLQLGPLKREARCPCCGTLSRRIHSRYLRHPWDLPWSCWPVQLCIVTRRFFCDSPSCQRSIFSEPFPEILEPYAQQTVRLQKAFLAMAHVGSAEGASRIAGVMGYFTSGDTLLRRQRREQLIIREPQVIGVDEFALRRGLTYGTLVVDLVRHRPIAILNSDQAEPFSEWLRAHPGIAIITRDRDESYARAARSAAPQAIQVADRFHLIKNVGDALKKVVQSHHWIMPSEEPAASEMREPEISVMKLAVPTPKKLARWEAVKRRGQVGQSISAIARELGMARLTVKRYFRVDNPPIYSPRLIRRTKLKPFLPYLEKRWQEGCQNAFRLYREIISRGYEGKYTIIRKFLQPWRKNKPSGTSQQPSLSRLLLRPQNKLNIEEQGQLKSFLQLNPVLSAAYSLKERFLEIVRQADVSGLETWVNEAEAAKLSPFRGMATSLRRDLVAVKNALILPWSNAQCEGQICRVKLIKCTGYGRAKIDLLRQRIIHRG